MLLLSFQPFTVCVTDIAISLLLFVPALAIRIMLRGTTHSRDSDMVKRRTGAAEASGTPPFGPTPKNPKRDSADSANSRNSLRSPHTEKPPKLANGRPGESNGHKAASNGHKAVPPSQNGEPPNAHKAASSNGHKAESSNGDASNGHRGESSNGYKRTSNALKEKSSGCSVDEPSWSSSESGLTVESHLKLDTAPTSSNSKCSIARIGSLEKKYEKLIINDGVTPLMSDWVLLPDVVTPPSKEVLPPSKEVSPPAKEVSPPSKVLPPSNEVLPPECIHLILGQLDWRLAVRLRGKLGKSYREFTSHPAFVQARAKAEGEYSPISFMVDAKDDLLWVGLNTKTRKWESLPSLNFAKNTVLPSPDPDLFKDYFVAGDGGLVCFNVGKSGGRESIVVSNPLTRQVKRLPPLKYPRHPVLMHFRMIEDGHYKIVVAGSAATGTEDVSLKTEEYDSRTGVWECPEGSDLPCQPFGLNEYQNGVQIGELLLCGAIIDTRGRGILIYDLKKKMWLQEHRKLHIPLVRTSESNVGHLATSQLVKCGDSVYVFSEQECGREVYFLIHKLNLDGVESNPWEVIMRRKRMGGRGLLVYPEFTCIAVSEHELAIFNTVEHTTEILDLNSPSEVASLRSVPSHKANRFHSLNPVGFPYRPSFGSLVCPRGRHPNFRCIFDLKQGQYCSECERRNSDSGLITVRSSPVTVANDGPIAEIPLIIAEPSPMLQAKKPSSKTRLRKQQKGKRKSVSAPLDTH